MAAVWNVTCLLVLGALTCVLAAPAHTGPDGLESKSDVPVEQLEKLKTAEGKSDATSEHVEYHHLDTVQANGELLSRVEEHATADATDGGAPRVRAHAELDVPRAGVHRTLDTDSLDAPATPPPPPADDTTPKVFHGAARLVQPGSSTNGAPAAAHTAARRAFNADITKETNHNMDHYTSYAGVQYSPLDMAEYVFWTGDERGVTTAIEDFLQEGMMTKEEAIAFLQEIKFNIDYLRAHYSQRAAAADEGAQQDNLRNLLLEQANAKEYQYRSAAAAGAGGPLQSFAFGGSPDILRSIAAKSWELSNSLPAPAPALLPEPAKRGYDPMLQTNVISTSDYERDGQIISEEEYEEVMDKLKAADSLYTEYTLEEIIYQLAKMMFSSSLSREPSSARAATQRFMAFLELEAERGQLSRTIEKKVLDVMIAALSDTIGEHPELLQPRDALPAPPAPLNPANRLMRQLFEVGGAGEGGVSRAILAAYKDELLKGPRAHTKLAALADAN